MEIIQNQFSEEVIVFNFLYRVSLWLTYIGKAIFHKPFHLMKSVARYNGKRKFFMFHQPGQIGKKWWKSHAFDLQQTISLSWMVHGLFSNMKNLSLSLHLTNISQILCDCYYIPWIRRTFRELNCLQSIEYVIESYLEYTYTHKYVFLILFREIYFFRVIWYRNTKNCW